MHFKCVVFVDLKLPFLNVITAKRAIVKYVKTMLIFLLEIIKWNILFKISQMKLIDLNTLY